MKLSTLLLIILIMYLYLQDMLFKMPVIIGIVIVAVLLIAATRKNKKNKKKTKTSEKQVEKKTKTKAAIHTSSYRNPNSGNKKSGNSNKGIYESTSRSIKSTHAHSRTDEMDDSYEREEEERIRQAKEDAYYYRIHNGPRHLIEEADDILGLTQKERDYYDDKYAQKCKECNELIDDCICCNECRTHPCECCEKCGEAPRYCRCCRECGEYPCECCEECGYARCRC